MAFPVRTSLLQKASAAAGVIVAVTGASFITVTEKEVETVPQALWAVMTTIVVPRLKPAPLPLPEPVPVVAPENV